jgi:hypothetical protein
MKGWTDPLLTDSASPGAGETNVNRAMHVADLRKEIQKASLFAGHLDERPVKTVSWQAASGFPGGPGNYNARLLTAEKTILDVAGSGVVRSFWCTFLSHKVNEVTIRIYVDGEVTPRINCLISEFLFCPLGVQSPYHAKYTGVNGVAPMTTVNPVIPKGGYRKTPIPFHSHMKITLQGNVDYGTGASAGLYCNVQYNHSATIDYDYGRYNFFNLAKAAISAETGPEFLSITGKAGALWSVCYGMVGEDLTLEGDTLYNADGAGWQGDSGTEDFFLDGWYWNFALALVPGQSTVKYIEPAVYPSMVADDHGVNLVLNDGMSGVTVSAYRYFDDAPICFDSSLHVKRADGDADAFPGSPAACTYIALYYTAT